MMFYLEDRAGRRREGVAVFESIRYRERYYQWMINGFKRALRSGCGVLGGEMVASWWSNRMGLKE